MYKCPTTNRSNNIEIEREIIKSPDYLIIQLKRFNYDLANRTSSKSKEYFNVNVDLSFDKKAYSLVGVCPHIGSSMENGHYISYVKRGDDWYECNDENVKIVNKSYDINTLYDWIAETKTWIPICYFMKRKSQKWNEELV